MPLDDNAIIVAIIGALPPTLVALLALRGVSQVHTAVEVVRAGVDGLSNEKAKAAADKATIIERERGEDTAEKVAAAGAAARLETTVTEAISPKPDTKL